MEQRWLEWAIQIQAMAQTGLTYATDPYDIERYEKLRELAVEILATYTSVSKDQVRLAFASDSGYTTPKVDIRAVIMQDGKILLVREKADGAWSLPEGWADIGLSPFQVAVKEVWEESGYEVKADRLLAVFDKQLHAHPPSPYYTYKIFIACTIIGGAPSGGDETFEVSFYDPEKLPELSLERITEDQIRTMVGLYLDPSRQALCD